MLFLAAAKFAIRSPILPPIKRYTLFIRRILKVAQISIILQRCPILNASIFIPIYLALLKINIPLL
jgi:hypothetical protein